MHDFPQGKRGDFWMMIVDSNWSLSLCLFCELHSVPQQRQATLYLAFGWFVPPAGDFGLGPKVTKSPPKAFPLGYLPFREQNSSCGTFSSRRRCISPAAASADQHSKHRVSLGVPRFLSGVAVLCCTPGVSRQ